MDALSLSHLPPLLPDLLTLSQRAGKAIMEVYTSDFAVEHKDDKSPLTLADKQSHAVISEGLAGLTGISIPVLSEEGRNIPYEERKVWRRFWLVDPLDGTKEFIKHNGEFTVNIALIENGRPLLGIIYLPVNDTFYFGAEGLGSYRLDSSAPLSLPASLDTILAKSTRLPSAAHDAARITVVGSRSHMSPETEAFIDGLKQKDRELHFTSAGSSLKFCILAEGRADVYPRFGPTMEWDTAAGQAIVEHAGGSVVRADTGRPLSYNKENLLNPSFICRSNNS